MKWTKKTIRLSTIIIVVAGLVIYGLLAILPDEPADIVSNDDGVEEPVETAYLYGLSLDEYSYEKFTVENGQSFGALMQKEGIGYPNINTLVELAEPVLNVTRIKAGKPYYVFRTKDSTARAEYWIYEDSPTQYYVFHLEDSLYVKAEERQVKVVQREVYGRIEGSLYESLQNQNVSPAIAVRLSEIYAWTIDFFRIQKGDGYKIIFEEKYIDDTLFVGTGQILASEFEHYGKSEFAFLYTDTVNNEQSYYSDSGKSLRKAFLKAPLEFARISSRFTMKRFHPVQKRWKAHLGTDYAAPTGTPIMSTADGTVEAAGYTSGNGNYVKVRHNSVYSTQYLHMSRFAKGIRSGVRVKQGDVIGYVGSTGLATGPHVCYRFWKNGKQVDPLKEKLPESEPLPEKWMPEFRRQTNSLADRLSQIKFD